MRQARFALDEPLADGEADAARKLKPLISHAHHLVSAPELRARQTIAGLVDGHVVDADLRDADYGRWAGRSLTDLQEREPAAVMEWLSSVEAAPHGGESLAALIDRVGGWLTDKIALGGHMLAVTHAAVIRAAIVSILDAPKTSFWKIDVQPLGITEITSDSRRWALRCFGRTDG
jgi:broad specificity phosphatase PhoE